MFVKSFKVMQKLMSSIQHLDICCTQAVDEFSLGVMYIQKGFYCGEGSRDGGCESGSTVVLSAN